eukprot:TRINITY_DN32426_c0_g1_i1.p1 TRINITY_DN32426_c0_g1~~TRINITY_DN32426_c0_g1_i1.p1  ORF type:complete len:133 (+),score=0.14 TRINITY_DN32426_c0_g1_i1:377-775(+)
MYHIPTQDSGDTSLKPHRCCSVFFQIQFTKNRAIATTEMSCFSLQNKTLTHIKKKCCGYQVIFTIKKKKVHDLEILQTQNKQVSCHCQKIFIESRTIASISLFVLQFKRLLFYVVECICASHIDFGKKRGGM